MSNYWKPDCPHLVKNGYARPKMSFIIYLKLVLNYDDIIGGAQFSSHLHTIIAVNSITKYETTIKQRLENLNVINEDWRLRIDIDLNIYQLKWEGMLTDEIDWTGSSTKSSETTRSDCQDKTAELLLLEVVGGCAWSGPGLVSPSHRAQTVWGLQSRFLPDNFLWRTHYL